MGVASANSNLGVPSANNTRVAVDLNQPHKTAPAAALSCALPVAVAVAVAVAAASSGASSATCTATVQGGCAGSDASAGKLWLSAGYE